MPHVPTTRIKRHKAAIKRSDYSRPVKCLWRDRFITPDRTLFDYGCGHGDDLAGLREDGVDCEGFDPVFRLDVTPQQADIVNIGYVLNVIEDLDERRRTLSKAWSLTERVLCVAARVVSSWADQIKGVTKSKGSGLNSVRAGIC